MIQASGQYGDSKSDRNIWPAQKKLNELFSESFSDLRSRPAVNLSVVLRVSGSVTDFEGDGPERLQYLTRNSELTIDYVIPQSKWMGVSPTDVQRAVGAGVSECIDLLKLEASVHELAEFGSDFDGVVADVFVQFEEGVPYDT